MTNLPPAEPSPSEPVGRPIAESYMLRRHAEKQGVSWSDAWRYFRGVGYTVDHLDPFEDTDEVRDQEADMLKERTEPYDPNNRPPLPANSAFASFDPLDRAESTPDQAVALEQFGIVAEQEPSTTAPMDPFADPAAEIEMPDVAGLAPREYRKRPATIMAIQFTGGAAQASRVIDWVLSEGGTARYHEALEQLADPNRGITRAATPELIAIDTLENVTQARAGWWIVRGIQGEFYPVSPTIFPMTFEDVPEDDGMENVRVPRDTLVFAVPTDFTVAELFRSMQSNLPQ